MPLLTLVAAIVGTLLSPAPWRLVHWWLIAVPVATTIWVLIGEPGHRLWRGRRAYRQRRRLVADRDLAWLMWHWVTGGPLEPRRAEVDVTDDRPRRARLAARAGLGAARTTAVMVAVGAGAAITGTAPGTPLVAVAVVGTAAAAGATWLMVWALMRTAHRLMWERPLFLGVRKLAGWNVDTAKLRRCVTVPRDRSRPGAEIVVAVAPDFPHVDTARGRVVTETREKLELSAERWSAAWVSAGRHGHVTFRQKKPMPTVVRYSDPQVRELIANCKESEVLFGLGRGGAPVKFDLDSDAPHMLLSASTGAGKSWTLHMAAAQLMAKGAEVRVVDYKRHSHKWVRHLDGIRYAMDLEDAAQLLIDTDEEAKRRNRMHDNVDLGDAQPQYQRIVLLIEELNSTADQLKAWWAETRTSKDPTRCPAITALRSLLFMGRAVKVHLLFAAQQGRADAIGGGDARENCGLRILAGDYTRNTAKMLAPDAELPPGRAWPGWAMIVHGSKAVETQRLMMSPEDARQLVVEAQGYQVVPTSGVAVPADAAPLGDSPRHVAVPRQPDLVTLWQASTDRGRGVVGLKYAALSTAARRDRKKGLFPEPVVADPSRPRYDPRDLRRWFELRSPIADGQRDVVDVDEVSTEDVERVGGTEGPDRMKVGRA